MNAPLYNALNDYISRNPARFHMPGHGGRTDEGLFASCAYDVTELDETGNLLEETGVTASAEAEMARAYRCARSLMLTQGATCGMHIAVAIAAERGKKVLTLSDMHRSFYNGCALFSVDAQSCTVAEVGERLTQDNDIGAVFVTSPDYFGVCADIDALRAAVDAAGAILIVDEAHGAHFAFGETLPREVSGTADVTVTSLHKTMRAYGGAALLNLKGEEFYGKALYYRSMLHSSSPSYLIMASMDYARAAAEENCGVYADIKDKVDDIVDWGAFERASVDDFSRLVLRAEGKDCREAARALSRRGYVPEAACGDRLVFIVTPYNYQNLDGLREAVKALDTSFLSPLSAPRGADRASVSRKPAERGTEFLEAEQCVGRICAADVGLYPPGTPFLRRGDKLSERDIIFVCANKSRLCGLVNGRLAVVK